MKFNIGSRSNHSLSGWLSQLQHLAFWHHPSWESRRFCAEGFLARFELCHEVWSRCRYRPQLVWRRRPGLGISVPGQWTHKLELMITQYQIIPTHWKPPCFQPNYKICFPSPSPPLTCEVSSALKVAGSTYLYVRISLNFWVKPATVNNCDNLAL